MPSATVLSAPGWWQGEGFGPGRVSFSPGELHLVLAGSHKCSFHLVLLLLPAPDFPRGCSWVCSAAAQPFFELRVVGSI